MHREWRDLKSPGERLRWAREAAGYEQPIEAAEALGMSGSTASTYFAHENDSRGLARAGARYAEFFRVSFDWLMRGKGAPRPDLEAKRRSNSPRSKAPELPPEVKIIGRVGAGPEGSILFDEEADLGMAPMPPGGNDNTRALEISGASARPLALDGWLVYFDDRRAGLTPEMFGQPCVIGLVSGHTVFKTPYPGSKRGLFNLESANPAVDTMRDQRVRWGALVTAIIPRSSSNKLRNRAKGAVSA